MVAKRVEHSAGAPTVLLVHRIHLDCARAYRLCDECIRIRNG